METIERCAEGTLIVYDDRQETVACGLKQVFNRLLLDELTTFQGRLDALKGLTTWQRDVPLFINQHCCLFVTTAYRDSTAVFVNCVAVVSIRPYDQTSSEICFKSLNRRRVHVPYSRLKRKYDKALQLLDMFTE